MGREIPGRSKSRAKALGQEWAWCIRGTARKLEGLQQGREREMRRNVDVMGHC